MLQAFKNPVQNTGLVPSAHAHIDRMPVSEPFREPPPFAPIFHDIQNGIEHLKVVVGDIASMDGETIRYTLVLHLANLHHATILTYFAPLDNILSEHSLATTIEWPRDFTLHNMGIPPSPFSEIRKIVDEVMNLNYMTKKQRTFICRYVRTL